MTGGTEYAGPGTGTITLGGSTYEGAFAGVTILRSEISREEADCLYRDGEGSVQVCATADMLSKERLTAYYGSFTTERHGIQAIQAVDGDGALLFVLGQLCVGYHRMRSNFCRRLGVKGTSQM